MIWVVCRISIQRLFNNKQELLVTFLVPLMFFSIFALIFSRGVGEPVTSVRVAMVDDDRTAESQRLLQHLRQRSEMRTSPNVFRTNATWSIDVLAKRLLSQHKVEVVVYIPKGYFQQDDVASSKRIQIFNDGSNPIAPRLVQANLAESIAMERTQSQLKAAAALAASTPASNKLSATNSLLENISENNSAVSIPTVNVPTIDMPAVNMSAQNVALTGAATVVPVGYQSSAVASASSLPVSASLPASEPVFESISPFDSSKHQPKIALYAAGIAVMFLLFSAGSAGGGLLEEREKGTLGRLLSSRLSIAELLAGKWLYLTGLGFLQTTLMFAWGQFAFEVDLVGRMPGFLMMTFFTSAACASFGILLAAACNSRQQLTAISMVIVLSMSAVGGSMVPRYIMSDSMKNLGKLTFNGWALDGYQKIFWYDLPTSALKMEVTILALVTVALSITAYLLAQRWKLA